MKNKLLVPFIIVSIVGVSGIGAMTGLFLWKNGSYNDLEEDYTTLDSDNQSLNETHQALEDAFQELLGTNEDLEDEIDTLMLFVKSLPLVEKMTFYYHLARMICFDHSTYETMAVTGAEMILHSSNQYNAFSIVDTMLADYDFFEYGDSMDDAWKVVENTFAVSQDGGPTWLDCWSGTNDEATLFNWVKNNIDYTYDSIYSYGRTYEFDIFLSAMEMLKMKRGDCDDFSILLATMLENNGFDTAFVTVHDMDHPDWQPGGLHHAFIFAKIDPLDYLGANLWSFGGDYEWLIVDVTPGWTSNIGQNPSWLQYYFDESFTDWGSIFNWAFADPPASLGPMSALQQISVQI